MKYDVKKEWSCGSIINNTNKKVRKFNGNFQLELKDSYISTNMTKKTGKNMCDLVMK